MNKDTYESPELVIRWFESDDVIAYSHAQTQNIAVVGIAPDDEW